MKPVLTAALLAALALPAVAAAASPIHLVGQNATYTLALSKVRGHSVTGATGRLEFDVRNTCDAYTVTQKMTLLIRNQDGTLSRTTSDYDTWEAKNGHRFTFLLRQGDGKKMEVQDQGTAVMGPKGGEVTYLVPKGRTEKLPPGTLFPMAHTRAILEAAEAGKPYIDPPLFDGTSTHGAEHTFVAILERQAAHHDRFAHLSKLPSTLVDIGFWPRTEKDDEPDFRTQMHYFTNGVSRDVRLDFGNFVMDGKLTALTILKDTCPSGKAVPSAPTPKG